MDTFFQIIAVAVGVLAFSMRFNVRGNKLIIATIGGVLVWSVYLIFTGLEMAEYLSCFLAVAIVTIYAECMARIFKTPVTVILAPSIIPMIPGASLYSSMNYFMQENWEAFGDESLYTLTFSASIAAGIVASTVICGLMWTGISKLKKYV